MLQEIGKHVEREREHRHDSSTVFDARELDEEDLEKAVAM